MTYAEALAVLARALKAGIHPGLDATRALVRELGDPHHRYASVQVAGTNGKTSTARLLAALLDAEGMRAALYTSPHLERYPERFEIAGAIVSDADFARAISAATHAALTAGLVADESVTEFELLTAAALWLFGDAGVDVAVLEVGLGGRWDATSVVSPAVAVITGIALDHTDRLGDTLEAIAAEKAAIIGPASAPVLGPGTAGVERVFIERAESLATHPRAVRGAGEPTPVAEELTARFAVTGETAGIAGETRFDVRGVHATYQDLRVVAPAYQAANAATAITAAEAVLGRALDAEAARRALRETRFPGRFELVATDPAVVVDGSHNPEAAAYLARAIERAWPDPAERPVLVLGVLADKDAAGIIAALAPVVSRIAVTRPGSPRALQAEALSDLVFAVTGRRPECHDTVGDALSSAVRESVPVVVAGSLVLAGEARRIAAERGSGGNGWETADGAT